MNDSPTRSTVRSVLPLLIVLAVAFYVYYSPEVGTTAEEIEALGWPFHGEDPSENIDLAIEPVAGSAPLTVQARAIEPQRQMMEKAGFGFLHTWDWGDGSQTFAYYLRNHTYTETGTYTVTLEVEIIKPATAAAVGGCGTASDKLIFVKTGTVTVE